MQPNPDSDPRQFVAEPDPKNGPITYSLTDLPAADETALPIGEEL
jgi:hypothetical protein